MNSHNSSSFLSNTLLIASCVILIFTTLCGARSLLLENKVSTTTSTITPSKAQITDSGVYHTSVLNRTFRPTDSGPSPGEGHGSPPPPPGKGNH
ncbi:unnamed protein product [Linum trigynum]|uniref:Uncharacterized protein n=1 Tax=Linum trigynum TaxID=586398 RepID=A0AAV2GTI4_9ROSI